MSQINEILDNIKLPQIMKVKQVFDDTKLDNVEDNLNQKLIQKNTKSKIKPGMKTNTIRSGLDKIRVKPFAAICES